MRFLGADVDDLRTRHFSMIFDLKTVGRMLAAADRYACLARTKEPHRSQLKAVIDHTEKHPVIREGRHKDDYTLGKAALDVWNKNKGKWSNVKGTFDRFEDFKSACYHLRWYSPIG